MKSDAGCRIQWFRWFGRSGYALDRMDMHWIEHGCDTATACRDRKQLRQYDGLFQIIGHWARFREDTVSTHILKLFTCFNHCPRTLPSQHVQTLHNPSLTDKKNLVEKWQKLQACIIKFEKKLSALNVMDHVEGNGLMRIGATTDGESEQFSGDDGEEVQSTPEQAILLLPSNITPECQNRLRLDGISQQEGELWIGQMNDALQQLKAQLGEKSLIMQTKVRIFYHNTHPTYDSHLNPLIRERQQIESSL